MNEFYECVVKYDKIGEEGNKVRVTEQYVVDALSCSEAEYRLKEELAPFVTGECKVTCVKVSKYKEFIPENADICMVDGEAKRIANQNSTASDVADKLFAAKVSFIVVDENNGKTKKNPYHYIVHSSSVDAANDTVFVHMKGSMADWEINGVTETKIVDVILYEGPDKA